jgi:hypothetical protein
VDATLHLPTQTLNWLTEHPHARQFVRSVWDKLTELERSGQLPGAIDALRRVLVDLDIAFGQQLLDIAVRDPIAQVPAHPPS